MINARLGVLGRVAAGLAFAAGMSVALAQPGEMPPPAPPAIVAPAPVEALSLGQLATESWQRAKSNDLTGVLALGQRLPVDSPDAKTAQMAQAFRQLEANLAKREEARLAQKAKVTKKLEEVLAAEPTALNLSKGLKEAVELHMLARPEDKDAVLATPQVQGVIIKAAEAARKAESAGEWVLANELYGRLNLLLEEQATYKVDARRLADRLTMLRLYNPKRFYDLRNARQLMEEGKKPLPPFNATGEDYRDKLKGITRGAVEQAIERAGERHVERRKMSEVLTGGLTALRTMVTTHDLDDVFPGLKNEQAVAEMVGELDRRIAALASPAVQPRAFEAGAMLADLQALSKRTVGIPDEAILHEFGNGAFDRLDEFSEIIWPDQLARFKRMTEGSFIGVGVQIQIDEESQLIKVVQPLEGTPAQRAGILAGDLIKKINEQSAVGMSLDQAIEQITGRRGTPVKLTMQREGQDIVFDLVRDRIPIRTAKGFRRTGNSDTDWDWFVNREAGIGYVRLSGFNENTTAELHGAIRAMGPALRGLILDLRFNPGGLLNEAVTVSNTFIPQGLIVYTESAGGVRENSESAEPDGQLVRNLPVIALINDGSASASEIVSGAIRHYARTGAIQGLVLGNRSFGKGSVQNVMQLRGNTMQMKLTTQYYHLPGGELIHRRDGAKTWGVEPQLAVEMLPKQISDSFTLRLDADTPPEGRIVRKPAEGEEPLGEPEPDRLITEGFDLQLEAAVLLLKAQSAAKAGAVTVKNEPARGG
jgi:carboxyl-terminal processing protease